ncbi:MAG TPA: MFS transporter [candidate division Zixibacteria bacterium]|nr:MFS transporter [candidate division Zixibacteria bacterium]
MNLFRDIESAIRRLPRNVWVVTAASFLTDVSSEMVFNFLPLFLANVLGVRLGIVGLIEGIAETTASIVKMYSGWFSDWLGKRKWLTIAGYSLSTVAKPFLFFAGTWVGVLAIRFTDRLGKGIRTAPRDALIADSVSEKRRGLAFGLHRAGDTAGAALGLSIALFVVWYVQGLKLELGRETFQLLALISVIPAVLAVIILIVGVKEIGGTKTSRESPSVSFKGLGRGFGTFLLSVIVFTLGNSSDAFIILRAQERGLNLVGIISMLIVFNLLYALVAGPAGALSDRINRRTMIVVSWLAYAVIYAGLALANSAWHVWVLFAIYGIYYGSTEGVSRALVADLVGADRRGSAYGVYNAAIGFSVLPASVIAGLLWQGIGSWQGLGASAPFIFGAAMALLAAGILFFLPGFGGRVSTSNTAFLE